MEFNLLSILCITKGPYNVHFGTHLTITHRMTSEIKVLVTGEHWGSLYFLYAKTVQKPRANVAIAKKSRNEWH